MSFFVDKVSINHGERGGAAVQANLADGVPKLHTFNVSIYKLQTFHELNLVSKALPEATISNIRS
jgi:hypothetical protein